MSPTYEPPENYKVPPFPSLYWPFPISKESPETQLYGIREIWWFTLIWNIIFFVSTHLAASVFGVLSSGTRNWNRSGHAHAQIKQAQQAQQSRQIQHQSQPQLMRIMPSFVSWGVPVVYVLVGGAEGVVTGSLVGLLAGAVYSVAGLRMSTWIPFLLALVNALVLVLSSFSMRAGL